MDRKTNIQELQIEVLKAKQLHKIAQKNFPNHQQLTLISQINLQFQIKSIKQKFINQLKIFLQLSKMSSLQLKAYQFDFNKYKQLLISKIGLIYKIVKVNKIQEQSLRRLQSELNFLQANFNLKDICIPYKYPITGLKSIKNQLVCQYIGKFRKQIEGEKQKTQRILMKVHQLRQLRTLRRQCLKDLIRQQQIVKSKSKPKNNIYPPKQVKKETFQKAKPVIQQQESEMCILESIKRQTLNKLNHKRRLLQQQYMQMIKQKRQEKLDLQNLLQKTIYFPKGQLCSDLQTLQLQKQLSGLRSLYDKINEKKYKQERIIMDI